jgi:hypothetical protein
MRKESGSATRNPPARAGPFPLDARRVPAHVAQGKRRGGGKAMADNPAALDTRLAGLQARIDAARAQLAARSGFEDDEVGDVLAAINQDFEQVSHDDAAAAHQAYDRIEARLADLQPLLSVLPR